MVSAWSSQDSPGDLTLVGRNVLKQWAHGTHLYDAIDDEENLAAA